MIAVPKSDLARAIITELQRIAVGLCAVYLAVRNSVMFPFVYGQADILIGMTVGMGVLPFLTGYYAAIAAEKAKPRKAIRRLRNVPQEDSES